MHLQTLEIGSLRNITALSLQCSPFFNFISGENGSGKTSVLEAIYLLGLGRSFKTHQLDNIIQHNQPHFSVFGSILNDQNIETAVGIEKKRFQSLSLKMNGKTYRSTSELLGTLPVQVINHDVFSLISAGPQIRREFLDWGVFHVKHSFLETWRQYHRCLKQRNTALKNRESDDSIRIWDETLVGLANQIEEERQRYFKKYTEVFFKTLSELTHFDLSLRYELGWDDSLDYKTALDRGFSLDKIRGFTVYGPHRSDFSIWNQVNLVKDVFSRGQLKIVSTAMRLAQGEHLKQETGDTCVYLIDDLPAELDADKRKIVSNYLEKLNAQVFISGCERDILRSLSQGRESLTFHLPELFHVEPFMSF